MKWGAASAVLAAVLAADAIFAQDEYPTFQLLFGKGAEAAHNGVYLLLAAGAAYCAYRAQQGNAK